MPQKALEQFDAVGPPFQVTLQPVVSVEFACLRPLANLSPMLVTHKMCSDASPHLEDQGILSILKFEPTFMSKPVACASSQLTRLGAK